MRKYRHIDPKSPAAFRRSIGQFVKFFIAWNMIGYCFYSYLKHRARKKDPEFDSKNSREQILNMMGKTESLPRYNLKISPKGISLTERSLDSDEQNTQVETDNNNQTVSEKDTSKGQQDTGKERNANS